MAGRAKDARAGWKRPERRLPATGSTWCSSKVYLIYDARTHRWTRGPSLEVPRHALAVYAINGTLYAIGGCVAPQLEDSAVVEKLALAAEPAGLIPMG